MSPRFAYGAMLCCGVLAGMAAGAHAAIHTCTSNDDCERGFTCESSLGERPDTKYCLLARCDSDADCPSGIVCVRGGELQCPQDTVDAERGRCLPPYAAECESDGDCGPYFHCVERETCGCYWAAETPNTPCGCRGDGVFRCEPVPADCDPMDESTCPAEWVCGQFQPTEWLCKQPAEVDGGTCDIVEHPYVQTCQPPLLGWVDCGPALPSDGGVGAGAEEGSLAPDPGNPVSSSDSGAPHTDDGPTDAGTQGSGGGDSSSCQVFALGATRSPRSWLLAVVGFMALRVTRVTRR